MIIYMNNKLNINIMNAIDHELIRRMQELRAFCDEHGYPLHEYLEEEIEYYTIELTKQYSEKNS